MSQRLKCVKLEFNTILGSPNIVDGRSSAESAAYRPHLQVVTQLRVGQLPRPAKSDGSSSVVVVVEGDVVGVVTTRLSRALWTS